MNQNQSLIPDQHIVKILNGKHSDYFIKGWLSYLYRQTPEGASNFLEGGGGGILPTYAFSDRVR